jgi:hypothetical protein
LKSYCIFILVNFSWSLKFNKLNLFVGSNHLFLIIEKLLNWYANQVWDWNLGFKVKNPSLLGLGEFWCCCFKGASSSMLSWELVGGVLMELSPNFGWRLWPEARRVAVDRLRGWTVFVLFQVLKVCWLQVFDSGWSRVNGGENSKQGDYFPEVNFSLLEYTILFQALTSRAVCSKNF